MTLALHHTSVAACQRAVGSSEFTAWQAYYRLEPFGDDAIVYQLAKLAALYADVQRDPKRHPAPFVPEDFMAPRPLAPTPEQRVAVDLRGRIDAAMAALGGRRRP